MDIYLLADSFYEDYPRSAFPEFLYKRNRPYYMLFIQINSGLNVAIPFRSNNTNRAGKTLFANKGLDYSHLVIIKDLIKYRGASATITREEFSNLVRLEQTIKQEISDYIEMYIDYKKARNKKPISRAEFRTRYHYSTLKYFHEELGVN